ncbi:hypothetical protein JKP88DRAFT_282540 [Tribonema minus]|uniref:Uncharacterized protein n=1 Tax=Tribonema minus TaxID=303371 RepID=A0A836CA08_9STRA|nr:hypothetical protein JKP88DRAFT_282540 [Tribonema minus]
MRRLEPFVEAADKPRILYTMAANGMYPKAPWALNRDMKLHLKPTVQLNRESLSHYPALVSGTRVVELHTKDVIEASLPNLPKRLRKWTIRQSARVAVPGIPNVERIDLLDIEDNEFGRWVQPLLEGLRRQRCSIGVLRLLSSFAFRPTAFPEDVETLLIESHDEAVMEGGGIVAAPDSVKHLQLDASLVPAPVPRGLQHLHLTYGIELGTEDIGALPEGLQTLRIASWCFDHPLGALPEALEVLDLKDSSSFNRPLGQLPGGLKALHLGKAFTRELGPLPPALQWLTLPLQYPHALAVPHTTHVAFVKHN